MTRVKLITFDVTGTLLSFKTPILKKYRETGLKFGINADPDILRKNFKEAWKTLNEECPNFGKNSNLTWQNWWAWFVEKTFSGFIDPDNKDKLSEIVENLIAFHTTKEAFTKKPGTHQLLKYLKQKSVTLGVISNYDPRLTEILEFMKLKQYFNFVLISYNFGHPKPNARIFEEALRLGGCVSGKECIHVGDDLKLDYLGAKEAGLKAILISSNEQDLKNSTIKRGEVLEDLFELKTYLKKRLD